MFKTKYVYMFNEGNAKMRDLLGGKGANLCEMTKMGLPVPYGFVVTTTACLEYNKQNGELNDKIKNQIYNCIERIEKKTGKKFGDDKNPLLLSVRSGARVSMPGMMDTILNLGLNDISVETLANKTNNRRFAYDSYRKFVQMYGEVVMGIDNSEFEKLIDKKKKAVKIEKDSEFTSEDLQELIADFKTLYKKRIGEEFPTSAHVQLINAVCAVFRSWQNPRAVVYRKINNIPSDWGTAVNIQTMVFGNMGETSGTGVAFTRNPNTGAKEIYGDYLPNAQGEDLVAGIRTPMPISELKEQNPVIFKQFVDVCHLLERRFKDMQDMEFTVENGKLYILQTRNGKRTGVASLQIATDMVKEKIVNEKQALMMILPSHLENALHPTFDPKELEKYAPIAVGTPASPGCATGVIALTNQKVLDNKENGKDSILIRFETSADDIEGMHASNGVVTVRGGKTSHAAVVARGMGIPCITGCSSIEIDEKKKTVDMGDFTLREGDIVSIDATTGKIYKEKLDIRKDIVSDNFKTVLSWCDKYSTIKVMANADTQKDVHTAKIFGADGVGLCRTEHMFFEESRIKAIREMIVADNEISRERALKKILPMQKRDFVNIYKEVGDMPVTIRLLDPPLHEFLPKTELEKEELVKSVNGLTLEKLNEIMNELKEFNPMLGFRGCRLAVAYPSIAKMQTRAILEARIEAEEKYGVKPNVEIMIPLITGKRECKFVKNIIQTEANEVLQKYGKEIDYKIGTMIEVPRACLVADEIAEEMEFFSFGTNDLTQMSYGLSRDDSTKFLKTYLENGLMEQDPFETIDIKCVGALMKVAIEKGRSVNKDLKIGICGEHGGEPNSVQLCQELGLNYVSCSPYRIAIAKLAGAQASIRK